MVVYSATKHIDGQGRALGGIVLGSRDFIRGTVEPYMVDTVMVSLDATDMEVGEYTGSV